MATPTSPPLREAPVPPPVGAAGRDHAVVVGASMAGLLAARVLAGHFTRVTLVDRDLLPDAAAPRRGVPQGHHLHVLQTRGERILGRLFPGLQEELLAAGATRVAIARDVLWYHLGGFNVRADGGNDLLAMSRPLLEARVRRRVLALPNVACRDGHDVPGLVHEAGRVAGVRLRRRGGEDPAEESLAADLVVDASGRGSRLPGWLAALGYERPQETAVDIGYGYTTRLYRRDPALLPAGAQAIYLMPTPPDDKRLGGLFPIEGERWVVTLGGYRGGHAPADEEGFLRHAAALSAPDLAAVLRDAEPLGGFASFEVPSSLRRHYERLRRFPAGLLVLGDAICSFNPIYGQGITVAALEAEVLARELRRAPAGPPAPSLARRFFAGASRVVDRAWAVSVGEDFRYAGVSGPRPPLCDLVNAYVGSVHRATHRDAGALHAFVEVMTMTRSPASLFRPRVVLAVLREMLGRALGRRRRAATAPAGEESPAVPPLRLSAIPARSSPSSRRGTPPTRSRQGSPTCDPATPGW